MKTRSGFVSNSSSSSFVVPRYSDIFSNTAKKLLRKGDEKGLEKLGFTLQVAYYPNQVENTPANKDTAPEFTSWALAVSCNQEDIIIPLLKAKLTFTADIHYGHYSMIYDGKTDKLIIAQNYGIQVMMGGTEKMTFKPWKEPGIEYTTGKEYIKKYEDSFRIRK